MFTNGVICCRKESDVEFRALFGVESLSAIGDRMASCSDGVAMLVWWAGVGLLLVG